MKYRVVKDTSRSQIDTIYNIPLHFKKTKQKHKTQNSYKYDGFILLQ